jgi:hypothetical protein
MSDTQNGIVKKVGAPRARQVTTVRTRSTLLMSNGAATTPDIVVILVEPKQKRYILHK